MSTTTATNTRTAEAAVTALSEPAAQAAVTAAAKALGLPTVREEAAAIATAAAKARLTHLAYLAEVLSAEFDEREQRRRLRPGLLTWCESLCGVRVAS